MIGNLPPWNFNNLKPSFNDLEAATAVEMVYKLYGKNRELIDDYNKFLQDIRNEIETFKTSTNQDMECFKANITKICNDYIATMDMKIAHQDKVIEDATNYVKENITEVANEIINEQVQNGQIKIATAYDETNKKLSIIITNTEGGIEE